MRDIFTLFLHAIVIIIRPTNSEAFPFDTAPKYLLRDRDRIYRGEFRKQVDVMDINEVLGAPRSPWQRAYVVRVIGSIAENAWTM